MKIKGIEVHPAANIFPLMGATALADLVEDIRANGQRESCSVYKGQLIDGRNRWLACQQLGIEPTIGEFEDDDFDVLAYVLSVNLHRRHLSDSQLAMIGAEVLAYHKARAKERQKAGGKAGREKQLNGVMENFPQPNGTARDEAGAAVGVSGRSVEHAATVLEHGSADLIDAVKANEVSVSKAAKIAKTTPKREQLAKANEPRKPPEKANTIGEAEAISQIARELQDWAADRRERRFVAARAAKLLELTEGEQNASGRLVRGGRRLTHMETLL